MKTNPILDVDFYKVSHKNMYVDGMTSMYSNLTPRNSKHFTFKSSMFDNKVVVFGIQVMVMNLVSNWNDNFFTKPLEPILDEYQDVLKVCLGIPDADTSFWRDLYELGHLPISIKALPEGIRCPIGVPVFTITNTDDRFAWLVNYLETYLSTNIWKPITMATNSYEYKRVIEKFNALTADTTDFIPWQVHDFSARGLGNSQEWSTNSIAHLTSFSGTDTVQAILGARYYYGADLSVGGSVPATEHSVMTIGINAIGGDKLEAEKQYLNKLLTELYPTGIVSVVCDSYDFWGVIEHNLPALKETILTRDGKLVIRPDCYDEETEIMTDSGWVYFKDLTREHKVAQVLVDGSREYVTPSKYVAEKYEGDMHRFKDSFGKVDLLVTPNHRMILTQKGKERIVTADKLKQKGNFLQKMTRTASFTTKTGDSVTPLEQLAIAFQADGSYTTTGNKIKFSFKKERKINRLETILKACDVKYKIYSLTDGEVEFSIKVSGNDFHKNFDWVDTTNSSKEWAESFIEELSYWDATRRSTDRFKFDTTTESVIKVVELIALGAGYGVLISKNEDTRSVKFSDVYTAHILKDNLVGGQSWTNTTEHYKGMIYCVTVPTGKLLVRRNRGTMVCGNSGTPIDVICGTDNNVENTKGFPNSFDKWSEWVAEDIDSKFRYELDAEEPMYDMTLKYKFNDEIYNVTYTPDLNRYDKTYYYVDNYGSTVSKCKFTKLVQTVESKGLLQSLWDIFGGTINSKGYKVLDKTIGIIYGDSITPTVYEKILVRMEEMGFSSDNLVVGVGGYTSQMLTRDTFSFAVKATHCVVDGQSIDVSKEPKTDSSKKSAKGLLSVMWNEVGELELRDQCTPIQEELGCLVEVLRDSKLFNTTTLDEIRQRLN